MIAFGTSGWRAIIAEGFTFENVRRVTDAIARSVLAGERAGLNRAVAIGYDTRFQSEAFAREAAGVLATHGIRSAISPTPIPTPAVAHAIRHHGYAGAINITASHNPAEYNGLKFSTEKGAPAPPETTRAIEAAIAERWTQAPPRVQGASPLIEERDFRDIYFEQLASLVRLDVVREAGIRLALDLRWGAAIGWLDGILARQGIPATVIHDQRDVTYGGEGPDVSERNLKELGRLVASGGFTLGLACDGDADRFGVVDADGTWITPNLILALLADYLAETRGFRQGLGRSYATTALIDAVAKHYGIPVLQTPVGFKYLGEHILNNRVFLAGEESAGMSMAGHLPEKDGLLAGLLAAEMVATRGASLSAQRDALFAKVGALHSARRDMRVTEQQQARLRAHMASPPARIGQWRVAKHTVLDGLRLDFDDTSWLLMRPSGTEPVVRLYAEAPTPEALAGLIDAGRADLIGDTP